MNDMKNGATGEAAVVPDATMGEAGVGTSDVEGDADAADESVMNSFSVWESGDAVAAVAVSRSCEPENTKAGSASLPFGVVVLAMKNAAAGLAVVSASLLSIIAASAATTTTAAAAAAAADEAWPIFSPDGGSNDDDGDDDDDDDDNGNEDGESITCIQDRGARPALRPTELYITAPTASPLEVIVIS